jgi:hypothetical protein
MPELFAQVVDLYLNVRAPQYPAQFFPSRYSGSSRASTPQFVAGDRVLLRLWLCAPAVAAGQPPTLFAANGPIVFAVKASTASDALLAYADAFDSVEDGAGERHYEAILNLATDEIATAFSGGKSDVRARLDIELQAQGNSRRMTFATTLQLVAQAYQGTEVEPVPSTPTYPAPGDIPSKIEIDTLVAAKVAAQLPAALAAAIASIPRITRAATATLQPGADATAAVAFPDPDSPDNPASGLLSLGIPRGVDGVVTGVPPTFVSAAAAVPTGFTHFDVSFHASFPSAPIVTASLVAPSESSPVIALMIHTILPTRFTAALASPVPTAGYIINFTAVSAH